MKRLVTLTIAGSILAGCATAYKPSGFSGGFSETQLAENVWRVRFNGNGYTRSQRAEDLALLRSAELTLTNGYTHFVLADSRTANDIFTTPSQYHTTSTGFGYRTTQTGGETFTKPSATNTVVMFKDRPASQGMVYDAKFICGSLGRQYEVVCQGGN